MSKLVQVYSNSCGLKIGKPFLKEKFFPLNKDKYFTIQGSSGQPSKCYDYFAEVLEILGAFLEQNSITVIQLGAKEDPPIPGCHHLMGASTLGQSYYILNRAQMHIGNDSWLVHAAGALGIPVVALYGSTSSQVHGPYFYDPNRTVLIDSHRNGNLPTYSQESPKTVNYITPESVANAILENCGIKQRVPQETLIIGAGYRVPIIEYVPDFIIDPNVLNNRPVTVRLDYHYNEENLFRILSMGRRVSIVTNKAINLDFLKHFKAQIVGVVYETQPSDTANYIRQLRHVGLPTKFITREKDPVALADLRLKLFDGTPGIEHVVDFTKEQFFDAAKVYMNKELDKNTDFSKTRYRSNKYLFSKGKIYMSKAAWLEDKSIPNLESNVQNVIDRPEFWAETQHFRIFNNLENESTTPHN